MELLVCFCLNAVELGGSVRRRRPGDRQAIRGAMELALSDMLWEARTEIEEWLSDPFYADIYAPIRPEIESVLGAMKALQEKIDYEWPKQ